MSRVEVHKFGGTSVGDAHRMLGDADLIIAAAKDAKIVVVASAMSKVTDALIAAAEAALMGDKNGSLHLIDGVLNRHREALRILAPGGGSDADRVHSEIERLVDNLKQIMRATVLLGEMTQRTRDRVIASGEKMSVRLLSLALNSRGAKAIPLDADTFLETDNNFGEANPLGIVADRTIRAALQPHLNKNHTPVVTGFCGIAPDGATTTLGRGGSDYTATLVASALDADEVTIWTDVDGVFSADPRVVPNARCVDQLNYREAAELSFYGAKVLHQRTMIPVSRKQIPVRTRNSFNPAARGTIVNDQFTPGSHPVKAISAIKGQALVSVEGKGMSGVPGVAARVFQCLADKKISVTMISQSSSESSISLVVPMAQSAAAANAIKTEFRGDLSHGDIEEIVVEPRVGIVACVGLGMAKVPGVAGRVFASLGEAQVNVLAIAQGSTELNISLAVGEDEIPVAVRTLHAEFGLHRQDTGADQPDGLDLMLLGCGSIGRALIEQIIDRHIHIFERFGLRVRIVSLADRSGCIMSPSGFNRDDLRHAMKHKEAGGKLRDLEDGIATNGPAQMVEQALSFRLSRPILVDVSDSDVAHEAFLSALSRGCDIVTANKKPLADHSKIFALLQEAVHAHGRILRSEATVGAGLPVIDTLQMLMATGDTVQTARGCLSGTLGFLMSALEHGERFSDAVRKAVELGYTEPDPVADLSGIDVARKATILARLAGMKSADTPVELVGLVDESRSGLQLEELFAHLRTLDDHFEQEVATAASKGQVLRFVAEIQENHIKVGPMAVAKDSPIGGLQGSDNMIVFTSQRYHDRPLVITGPGAGIDVTAMGVLGDILRIAAERRQA